MIDYIMRYVWIFGTIAVFAAGWYSGYTYYDVKQLKIDLNATTQDSKNKDLLISKMETSEKITNDILAKSAIQHQQEKINYETVYTKLQNITKQLDSSNHVNAILVRTVQYGINGKTVPKDANTTRGINEKAATYRASDFASGIIKLGQSCTENTNQLLSLQEWIKQQYDRQ